MKAIVYQVTNTVTNDTYIGVTRFNSEDRWRRHLYTARTAPKTRLHQAIAAQGAEFFSITEIATCLDINDAWRFEQMVIQDRKPTYNQTNGGQFTVGKRVAPEVIEKIRAGNTGKKRTPEQREAMSLLKRKQYAERPDLRSTTAAGLQKARLLMDRDRQRAAVGNASRERVWSVGARKKLSNSMLGNTNNLSGRGRCSARTTSNVTSQEGDISG
jgi:hypothetical protein